MKLASEVALLVALTWWAKTIIYRINEQTVYGAAIVSRLNTKALSGGSARHPTRPIQKDPSSEELLQAPHDPAPRALSVASQVRITAKTSYEDNERLFQQATVDAVKKGLEKNKEARTQWRRAGARHEELRALCELGDITNDSGNFSEAIKYYSLARSLSRTLRDQKSEITALVGMSRAYLALGENRKALYFGNMANGLSVNTNDLAGQAAALNNIGEAYYGFGQMGRSVDYFKKALALWNNLGDVRGQALAFLNMGYSYSDQSDNQAAAEAYDQALARWRMAADRRGEARTLTAVGHLKSKLGEKQEALDLYRRAAPIMESMRDPVGLAFILNGMGYIYEELGEKTRALESYDQALRYFRTANYREGEAGSLLKMGENYSALGDHRMALDHYRMSLSVYRKLAFRRLESYALRNIGSVYAAMGEINTSLGYYQKALRLNKEGRDARGEAHTLRNIGGVYAKLGDGARAITLLNRALTLHRSTKDVIGESLTLCDIALAERDRGNLHKARQCLEESLLLVESLRTQVANEDLRTSFLAVMHRNYEGYVDTLMQMHKRQPSAGFDALAFEASERARARTLLETLSNTSGRIRRGVPAELLGNERTARLRLSSALGRKARLLAGHHTEEQLAQVERDRYRAAEEYDNVRDQIKKSSPGYAALTQVQRITLGQVQQSLDGDTLLLEYSLGEKRSYLWAVTRETLKAYVLPEGAKIEAAARNFYNSLTAPQPVPGETLGEREERIKFADEKLLRESVNLGRLLLGPVTVDLIKNRLLVIPDGALQYIPFQVLIAPGAWANENRNWSDGLREDSNRPLAFTHEIVYEPSAATLAQLESETARRKPAPLMLAVLADPVFESEDPRIGPAEGAHGGHGERAPKPSPLDDEFLTERPGKISRLLLSGEEGEAILKLVPRGEGLSAIGFEATREAAMTPALSKYRVIHFATHAFVDDKRPDMSGIALSLRDRQGRPRDGILRLYDIYNLNLPAELVVLSACNTGLGKEVRGEGLIGLTRGFMYAGAAQVMASLWRVEDEASTELMKYFYQAVLKDGLRPAAALRNAQARMENQNRWRSPYYWAGFILQGSYNGRAINSNSGLSNSNMTAICLTAVGILITASYFARLALKKRLRR